MGTPGGGGVLREMFGGIGQGKGERGVQFRHEETEGHGGHLLPSVLNALPRKKARPGMDSPGRAFAVQAAAHGQSGWPVRT